MQLHEYAVWDRTTRLFHWINLLCVLGLIAIGTAIINAGALGVTNPGKILLKTVHVYVGYVFAVNLLWRLIWGFIGGRHARWRAILPGGPDYRRDLAAELSSWKRGHPVGYVGHTPLGRIAVTVLLAVLTVQAITGLILAGTDVYMPPLGGYFAEMVKGPGMSAETVRPYAPETVDPVAFERMRYFRGPVIATHENLFFLILGLVALHVAVVVAKELMHGGGLVSAMITGRKAFATPPRDAPDD